MMRVDLIIRALGDSQPIPSILGAEGLLHEEPWEKPWEWKPPFGCTGEEPDDIDLPDDKNMFGTEILG